MQCTDQISKLASLLIVEAAAKKRSLDYTQLLQMMGWASEYGSRRRTQMTAVLLPEIARLCHEKSLPVLSVLAVSSVTRKPEQWFEIFAKNRMGVLRDANDERSWRLFVNQQQKLAVAYWGVGRKWDISR